MKPNFALNLSHEGISLLHRAQAGWARVGDISLDDPNFVEELAVLRRTATDLEAGGLTTKLVIPNSQILYIDIAAPGPGTSDRIAQIRDGLVGMTPYDVRDLIFDWRMKGKVAQVAVVARDTLHEAESFATQYRFNPVSFVAVPANGTFPGEPFFGPTRHAETLLTGGESIQPDSEKIRVLGTEPAPAAAPKKKPAKSKPDETAEAVTGNGAVPAGDPAPVAAAAEVALSTAADPAPAFVHETAKASETPTASEKPDAAAPKAPATDADASAPLPAFASRRAAARDADHAPAGPDGPATSVQEPAPHTAPALKSKAAEKPLPRVTFGAGRPDTLNGKAAPIARAPLPPIPPRRSPPLAVLELTNAEHPAPTPPAKPTQSRAAKPLTPAKAARSAMFGVFGKLARGKDKAKPPAVPTPVPVPKPPAKPVAKPAASVPATTAKPTASEVEAMTVFGARGQTRQRGKPRYLGLVLTSMLLLALAVVALWSTYFMSDVTAGWFGTFEEETEIVSPDIPLITTPEPLPTIPPPSTGTATGTPEVTAETLPPASDHEPETAPPTPAPANTDPVEAAPATEPLPQVATQSPDQPSSDAAAIDEAVTGALREAAEPDGAATDSLPGALQDVARLEEPASEAAPQPEVAAPAPVRQPPLTPAEAAARYAATGIWQLDPAPLESPGGGRLDDLYIASIDPDIASEDALALPPAPDTSDDLRPPGLTPPAPLGTVFDFDERGLVRATPEGAISPEGVQVFSGRPATVPGPRPVDLAIPQDDTSVDTQRLQLYRPTLRPASLEVDNERANLGGFSRVELAALRPTLRPAQPLAPVFAPDAQAQPDTAGEDPDPATTGAELDNATELAVAASRMPSTRPQNFSSLVDKALEEARAAPPPQDSDATPVAAARVPKIPTRASVAKQATETDAINLKKINLIGVYGSPSDRRALVRLPSGKYLKVEVGDRVDGGRVAAIGESELRYVKGGRNIMLTLPKG